MYSRNRKLLKTTRTPGGGQTAKVRNASTMGSQIRKPHMGFELVRKIVGLTLALSGSKSRSKLRNVVDGRSDNVPELQ